MARRTRGGRRRDDPGDEFSRQDRRAQQRQTQVVVLAGGLALAVLGLFAVVAVQLMDDGPEPEPVTLRGTADLPGSDRDPVPGSDRRPPDDDDDLRPDDGGDGDDGDDDGGDGDAVRRLAETRARMALKALEVEHQRRVADGRLAEAAEALAAFEMAHDEAPVVVLERLRELHRRLRQRAGEALDDVGKAVARDLDAGDPAGARARLTEARRALGPLARAARLSELEERIATAEARAERAQRRAALKSAVQSAERAGDPAAALAAWRALAAHLQQLGETSDPDYKKAAGAIRRWQLELALSGTVSQADRAKIGRNLGRLRSTVHRWMYDPSADPQDREWMVQLGPAPALLEALIRLGKQYRPERPGALVRLSLTYEKFSDVAFVGVPPGYDHRRRYPLLVYLHGTSATVGGCQRMAQYILSVSRGEYLVLVPHTQSPHTGVGWGPTRYGIDPLFTAIDACMARFNVDPDAVGLTGQSMGGHATWNIGMQHADRFSALAPKASSAHNSWQAGMFPNLRLTPMLVIHGARDKMVPVRLTRQSVERARKAGVKMDYREFPRSGHEGAPWSEVNKSYHWLASQRRVRYPRRLAYYVKHVYRERGSWVRYDAWDPRYEVGRVKFVTGKTRKHIETAEQFMKPAGGELVADGKHTIEITRLVGVKTLTLYLHPELVEFGKPARIRYRGRVIKRFTPEADIGGMLDRARTDPWRPVYWSTVTVSLR